MNFIFHRALWYCSGKTAVQYHFSISSWTHWTAHCKLPGLWCSYLAAPPFRMHPAGLQPWSMQLAKSLCSLQDDPHSESIGRTMEKPMVALLSCFISTVLFPIISVKWLDFHFKAESQNFSLFLGCITSISISRDSQMEFSIRESTPNTGSGSGAHWWGKSLHQTKPSIVTSAVNELRYGWPCCSHHAASATPAWEIRISAVHG